ncbi:hypothetical protein QQ045_000620 [Rhodiola kirilowii]
MDEGGVHSQRTTVAFSWENKPGVSKVVATDEEEREDGGGYKIVAINKLPLPPCPSDKPNKFKLHQGEPLHVPLPPSAFDQRPLRSLSKRGFKIEDDPFLMAYKECTKSSRSQRKSSSSWSSKSSHVKTLLGYFSCKASSRSVRDGSTVRSPQPIPSPSDIDELDAYKI